MITYDDGTTYYDLEITATDAETEIWLGCDQGHFVCKATGTLHEGLLPGNYTVEFGLGTTCYPVSLTTDSKLTQSEIESGPSCERPKPVFDD